MTNPGRRRVSLYLGANFGLRIVAFLFLGTALACTHSVHIVHTSDFSPSAAPAKGKAVEARSEQFTILGFVTDTNYVEEAVDDIKKKCPQGEVRGITTQISTSHGFFSWRNKALIKGTCYS